MALYIVEADCISCGDCEPVCPTMSITEGSIVFKIDKKTCTECKDDFDIPQCVKVCPIDNCILPLEA
ncbi:4Fe-4S dicluster domain-containing protein [Methylobacter svalbardensis]|uniref:4Fe-4S dicluster domain-containing protein n=1 Tax=Methylobacter svalbardensis TaxID=3080016 RepID=UPI0030EF24B3